MTCECGNPDAYPRSVTYTLPLCDACWQARQARGMEGEPDAVVNIPPPLDGAMGWAYREPEVVGREGCDLEIEIGGRVMYQQRPPTHVGGSAYRQPKVHRTVARELSEAEAAREIQRQAADALAGLTGKQADVVKLAAEGMPRREIVAATGLSLRTVKDRLARARKASKGSRS